MSKGQFLSLEEARKLKELERFAEEHPSSGDKKQFDALLDASLPHILPGDIARGLHQSLVVKPRDTIRGCHLERFARPPRPTE